MNVVEFVIKVKDEASAQLKSFGKKVEDWFTLPHIVGAALITKGISTVIKAYGEQEEAIAKLNAALKAQGTYTEETSKALLAQASAFQKTTTFADQQITAAQALLIQMGVLPENLEAVTKTTLDWAAAMGKDSVSAATDIGKAVSGNLMMLQRYGIQLDKNRFEAEGMNYVLEEMNKRFGGTAEAVAQKGTGSLKQFGNQLGDLYESIGREIIPVLNVWIGWFGKLLKPIENVVIGIKTMVDIAGTGLAAFAAGAANVFSSRFGKDVPKIMADAAADMEKTVLASAEKMRKTEEKTAEIQKTKRKEVVKVTKEAAKDEAKIREDAMKDFIRHLEDEFKIRRELRELDYEDVIEVLESMLESEKWTAEERKALEEELYEKRNEMAVEYAARTSELYNELSTSISGALSEWAKGHGSFIEAMGSAWKGFKDYIIDEVLKTIADAIVKQIVQATILKSLLGGATFGFAGKGILGLLGLQEGGIITKPTIAAIGEAGAEAIIPLDKMRGGGLGGGLNIESLNITIQFPEVTSFKDWQEADPVAIKDVFERKIFDVFKLLARENKMEDIVK